MEALQKEKKDLDKMIEGDKKIVAGLDSTIYEREAAEARIEQHQREKEWVTTRLNATKRDLGLQDERRLREKIKEIFKKYGTVTAIFLAIGATIGAVFGTIAKYVKPLGENFGRLSENSRQKFGKSA